MRIGIFADQLFYDQPGGIGTYLRHIIPGIARRLEDGSLVLAHHGQEGSLPLSHQENVVEQRLPLRRDITGVAWHSVGMPRLERYLGDLDLVHSPSLVFPPSRAPLVGTVHDLCILKYPGMFPNRWRIFHHRGLNLILRHARVILVDSQNTYNDLRSYDGGNDSRIKVVPLGVHAPASPGEEAVEGVLRKYSLDPGYILFVGTIEPRKNLSRLVQAYSSLSPQEKKMVGELVLVGASGWMGRRELSRILSQQGVRWLGFLPQVELEAIYAAAGFFVYPSLYEGFGLPVLEAMARGLAVVTSDTSSLREVGEGVALLVDPEDPMDLARAMRRLIGDGNLRGELVEKGREKAAEFSWDRTVELTMQAYKDAILR